MRLLFTVDQAYLPERTGGALVSTDALCRALSGRGHEVAVLAKLMPNSLLGLSNRLRRRIGLLPPYDTAVGYPVYREWNPIKQVSRVCRSFRPDIAIVKSSMDPVMETALSSEGVPVLCYLRDLDFDQDSWQMPDGGNIRFVSNTTFASMRFEDRFGIRPPVIHSLIDADQYRVSSSREVVTFINPHPWKGLDVALDLARQRPDIPFEFVESWPLGDRERNKLSQSIASLPNVTFTRWMPDIRVAYAKTRVLIVPSQLVEAQARCVAEVHASGIPVIASEIGGLPEAVGTGGTLVPPTDTEGWRRALDEIWDASDAYEQASQRALEHSRRPQLQPDHIVSNLLDLIESQVAEAARA